MSTWWKETVVYQIYPRSFMDGNGDGVGDLEGIIGKLDYLKDLGIETIWFSPFYRSPQADFGYDISDYRSIAPAYGDMTTCERLIEEVHRRGMRVVFDMVLNHTSDQHPWFKESRSSRDNPKRDWYVWRDGRKPGGKAPPNNWNAIIGGSGWHYDPGTDQWYWAQFLPFQPDLNYRNPEVQEEMLGTLRFWMDRGVDGFRLDIVNALFEDAEFRNNPFKWTLFPTDEDPTMLFQGTDNTMNHPDTLEFMEVLRTTVGEDRFLVGEVNAPVELVRAHCGADNDGLHLVFLFKSLAAPMEAPAMREVIREYEELFPEPLSPTWVFGNHDRRRRISRIESDPLRARLNAAWQLTARGVPFIYYGEEIGMEQQELPVRDSQDALVHRMAWMPTWGFSLVKKITGESINRDECRTPMQWEARPNGGFCPDDATPWLPLPADPKGRTVADQADDPESILSCYKRFLALRKAHPALRRGSLELLPPTETGPKVVGYRRTTDGETLLVLLNASGEAQPLKPATGKVLASTHPEPGAEATLRPWEGIVCGKND